LERTTGSGRGQTKGVDNRVHKRRKKQNNKSDEKKKRDGTPRLWVKGEMMKHPVPEQPERKNFRGRRTWKNGNVILRNGKELTGN